MVYIVLHPTLTTLPVLTRTTVYLFTGNLYIVVGLYPTVVVEWVIAFSVAANVFLGLGIYVLYQRVPTLDQLEQVGEAVIDAQLEKRGFGDAGAGGGGRAGEGIFDKILRIPGVQNAIGGAIQNWQQKQGMGVNQYGP